MTKRWQATINYRHNNGPRPTIVLIEELSDLAAFVEHGPCWDCITNINIKLMRLAGDNPNLTVEEAATL